MNPDPFEQELARVPLRPPPPAWREEILARALPAFCRQRGTGCQPVHNLSRSDEAATAGTLAHAPGFQSALRLFRAFCRNHLSPGWSAVAAVWLVILGLNRLAASGDAPAAARPPLSPDYIAAVRAQQAELLRLAELDEPVPAPPPAPAAAEEKPRPRGPRAQGGGLEGVSAARLAALECAGLTALSIHAPTAGTPPGPGTAQPKRGHVPALHADRGRALDLACWNSFGALNFELGA